MLIKNFRMDKRKQIGWITNAQILGCILVVAGHSFPFGVEIPNIMLIGRSFLYSFHMAFFVFISGFLFGYSRGDEKYGTILYIKKRFIRLMVPYFVISLVGLIPKLLAASYINDAVPNNINCEYLITSLFVPRDGVWGHFWFLPMLFLVQLIGLLGAYLYNRSIKSFYLVLILSFLIIYIPSSYVTKWFSISDICIYLFWYLLGFQLAKMRIEKYKISVYWTLAFVVVSIIIFKIWGYMLQPLVAALMILFMIGCCQNIAMEKWMLFKKMVGNSFSVFILSWPVQASIEVLSNKILHLNAFICMFLMFSFGIIVPLIIIYYVRLIDKKLNTNKLSLIIGA